MKVLLTAIAFVALAVSARSQQKTICITIDDLPVVSRTTSLSHYRYVTERIVKTLTEQRAPAIGFVNEGKIYVNGILDEQHADLLRHWHKNGLELGNHTLHHMDYHSHSIDEFEREIIKGEKFLNTRIRKGGSNTFAIPTSTPETRPRKSWHWKRRWISMATSKPLLRSTIQIGYLRGPTKMLSAKMTHL